MKKKKGIVAEFKKFIMRGNVIDLAVGVIIGGAFQSIVKSLVGDIIMPLIGMVTGNIDFSQRVWKIGEGDFAATVAWGSFITAVLNFIIMAVIVFAIVKVLNIFSEKTFRKKEEPQSELTTKICPFCKSEIDINAVKCPFCTSDVE